MPEPLALVSVIVHGAPMLVALVLAAVSLHALTRRPRPTRREREMWGL